MRRKMISSGLILAVLSVGLVATSEDDWDTDGGPSRSATVEGPSVRLTPDRPARTFRLTATARLGNDPPSNSSMTWQVAAEARSVAGPATLLATLGPCAPDPEVQEDVVERALPVDAPQGLDLDLQNPAPACAAFTDCDTVACLTLSADGADVRIAWTATAMAAASYSGDVTLSVQEEAE